LPDSIAFSLRCTEPGPTLPAPINPAQTAAIKPARVTIGSVESTRDSILIRPASERDFPAVVRIQQHCPETAQWPLGDYSGFPVLLALIGSTPAGFCSWRQSAPDEAEILNLAVDPPWRRRGVGSALLEAVRDRALGAIFLEVAEPNSPAIALYRKQGWVDVGCRPGYYNHGTVNAVVMKKSSW
jgi:ribosomal-protein-alanine N-acetyltransferase